MTENMYLFDSSSVDTDEKWGRVFSFSQKSTAGVLPYYYMPHTLREIIDPTYALSWNQPLLAYGRGAVGGMTVRVLSGAILFEGRLFYADVNTNPAIAASDPVTNRVDALVIEFDKTVSPMTAAFKVITGSSATVPPTLTKSTTVYQVLIAYVFVGAGVTSIAAASCYDAREYCTSLHTLNFAVGDGNALVQEGIIAQGLRLPRAIHFVQADLYADQSGSVSMGISDQAFSSSPSTANSIIVAPATTWGLSSALSNRLRRLDGLTGITAWNKSNSAGSGIDAENYLTISCSAVTSITRLFISLTYFDLGNKEII